MEKNVNKPILRFPEFKGEWKILQIGDKFPEIVVGFVGTVSDSYCDKEIGIPFIRTLNVKDGYFSLDNIQYVTHRFHSSNKKSKIFNEDILIARVGANMGQVCKVEGLKTEANSANVIIIKKNENNSSSFFAIYLSSDFGQKQIKSRGAGGAQEVLNISVTKTILVPNPSLPEQQKIASFLTAVDDKLQALKKKKTLLEQYKKGMMQKIFSQELRFKANDGSCFPEWEVKKLGEIAEKRILKNKENTFNLVFTNSAVQGIVNQRDFFDKDIANQNNLMGYYIVENNDFVYNPRISSNAPVGPISRNKLETGVMSPLYSVFRFKKGNLNFMEHFFNCDVWHEHMNNISNQGARDDRMSFLSADFYEMPIPYPIQSEQTKITSFLSAIDEKINHVQSQIEKMELWKKGLLQKMFV